MRSVVQLKVKPTPKRRRVNLSNETISRLHLQPGERVYDTQTAGFYAQAGKRGIVFRVLADPPTKARRARGLPRTMERTIGVWPDISAAKARAEAQRMIGLIKTGTDPNEPERVDESPTVAKALEDFVTDLNKRVKAGDRQPSTVAFYEKSFARFDKRITKLPLTAIGARRGLLKEAHATITRKSGPVAADHSIITFRALWNHARRTWPELPESPTIAVEMNRIPDRADSGMGLDDLKPWWSEVQKLRNPVRQQLSLFMLLTGLRSNDARTAKAEHLDEIEKTLHVPQPKGGRKRAFDLPLSDAALGCIRCAKEAWRTAGHPPSDYLFPSARGAGFLSSPRIERHMDGERDRSLPSGHKLRHTFATVAEACGFTEEVYGVLLNHRATTVTGKYPNRKKNVTLYRQVADDIAKAIMGAIGNA